MNKVERINLQALHEKAIKCGKRYEGIIEKAERFGATKIELRNAVKNAQEVFESLVAEFEERFEFLKPEPEPEPTPAQEVPKATEENIPPRPPKPKWNPGNV